MTIYAYQKASDAYTTYTLRIQQGQRWCELATIEGTTYTFVEGELGPQPEQISPIAVGSEDPIIVVLREQSRACRVISEQVVSRIRELYSIDDEIKMLRIAPSVETDEWNAHVEACREWGRGQRAMIGL